MERSTAQLCYDKIMNLTAQMQPLCDSRNGKRVMYDPVYSHAATHFADAPGLAEVVIEIISNRDLYGEKIEFDTDMGRIIGEMDVVDVNERDDILYAKRKNRDLYVPFVKNRSRQPTNLVSIGLLWRDGSHYELTSAWFGELESPPFPGEEGAGRESIDFWNIHAFVWGSQSVQEDTITPVCPW